MPYEQQREAAGLVPYDLDVPVCPGFPFIAVHESNTGWGDSAPVYVFPGNADDPEWVPEIDGVNAIFVIPAERVAMHKSGEPVLIVLRVAGADTAPHSAGRVRKVSP